MENKGNNLKMNGTYDNRQDIKRKDNDKSSTEGMTGKKGNS